MPVFLLQHFMQHTTVTKSSPVLLLLDNHQSGVTTHSSTSGLNAEPSTSQGNQHYLSLVDIRYFPEEGVRKETRKRESRMSAASTDTLVMAALQSEVHAHCKPLNVTGYSVAAKRGEGNNHLRRVVRRNESLEEADDGKCLCHECAEPYLVSKKNPIVVLVYYVP